MPLSLSGIHCVEVGAVKEQTDPLLCRALQWWKTRSSGGWRKAAQSWMEAGAGRGAGRILLKIRSPHWVLRSEWGCFRWRSCSHNSAEARVSSVCGRFMQVRLGKAMCILPRSSHFILKGDIFDESKDVNWKIDSYLKVSFQYEWVGSGGIVRK